MGIIEGYVITFLHIYSKEIVTNFCLQTLRMHWSIMCDGDMLDWRGCYFNGRKYIKIIACSRYYRISARPYSIFVVCQAY